MSAKFVLVFWSNKKTSIISVDKICGGWDSLLPEVDTFVDVLCGEEIRKGKILRYSISEKYLKKLKVSKDGKIIKSQPLSSKNKRRNKNDRLQIKERISTEYQEIDDSNANNKPCCEYYSLFSDVTQENITFFEKMLNLMKMKYEQNSSSVDHSEIERNEKIQTSNTILSSWKDYAPGKVELSKGSGVWIMQTDLQVIIHATKDNMNEMIRKLLKHLLDDVTLAKSCAVGLQSRPGIEPQVKNAVKAYVEETMQKKIIPRVYHRVINLMCYNLADKLGYKKGPLIRNRSRADYVSKREFPDESDEQDNNIQDIIIKKMNL